VVRINYAIIIFMAIIAIALILIFGFAYIRPLLDSESLPPLPPEENGNEVPPPPQ